MPKPNSWYAVSYTRRLRFGSYVNNIELLTFFMSNVVCWIVTPCSLLCGYVASQPEDHNLHLHRREKLKSKIRIFLESSGSCPMARFSISDFKNFRNLLEKC
jgi:hypothetical protein